MSNSREGNTLPIIVLTLVLVPALLIVGIAIVVGIVDSPGPPRPAPARSLEERDQQDRAEDEARLQLRLDRKPPVLGGIERQQPATKP